MLTKRGTVEIMLSTKLFIKLEFQFGNNISQPQINPVPKTMSKQQIKSKMKK